MFKWLIVSLFALIVAAVVATVSLQAPTSWTPGEVVQTPEERFANLPDFPFEANYFESLGYRIHYLDEGPADGEVVLLMHGQPSWSYLYRHMIPPLVEQGYRVIAPDLVGFGKSDKPLKQSDHNYQMHVDVMSEFVRQLNIQDVTLFAQDWGGLIGLRIVAKEPDRFARIMLSNTGLPAADGIRGWIGYPLFRFAVWREGQPETVTDGDDFSFTRWVAWAKHSEQFDFQGLFQQATSRELSQAELDAYAAPFPDESYQSAVRIFPFLVPSQLRQNAKVMRDVYEVWDKPFMTAFSDSDPVTAGLEKIWIETVPGAADQPHPTVTGGSHFVQEDRPEELVRLLSDFIERNP